MDITGITREQKDKLFARWDSFSKQIMEKGETFPTLTEIVESVGETPQERYFFAYVLGRIDEASKEIETNDDYHR